MKIHIYSIMVLLCIGCSTLEVVKQEYAINEYAEKFFREGVAENKITPNNLYDFFVTLGLQIDNADMIKIHKDCMEVTTSVSNHKLLSDIMQDISSEKPVVNITVRGVKVENVDDLGFDWIKPKEAQ